NRVWRGRCAIEPTAIAVAVRRYTRSAIRIGLETGPLTTWLWTALRGLADGLSRCAARQEGARHEGEQNRCQRRRGTGAFGACRLVPRGQGQKPRHHAGEALLGARSQ